MRVASIIATIALLLGSLSAEAQKTRPYYHEDLYTLRPRFDDPLDTAVSNIHRRKSDVVPHYQVNARVDSVLDSINRFNVTRKFIEGYTVQIY